MLKFRDKDSGEKVFGLPRGRGGRGVWGGEFRHARAFRRSEAEAVSSVQKMFEQSCIIPHKSDFRKIESRQKYSDVPRLKEFAKIYKKLLDYFIK